MIEELTLITRPRIQHCRVTICTLHCPDIRGSQGHTSTLLATTSAPEYTLYRTPTIVDTMNAGLQCHTQLPSDLSWIVIERHCWCLTSGHGAVGLRTGIPLSDRMTTSLYKGQIARGYSSLVAIGATYELLLIL